MRKIFLIIILLITCNGFTQDLYLHKLRVRDSINAGAYYLNGVPFSAGGGDVYLGNRQTFTSRNVFSDTLKADGLSLIDDARITSQLNVTGDVISDLQFLKGSRVRIGSSDSYRIDFKTADTNRFYIDSLGYAGFNKSLAVGTYLLATDSVITDNFTTDNIYLRSMSNGIIFRGYNSQISEDINQLKYISRQHNFLTKGGYNFIANLDSSTGMNLIYGDYYRNGVLLFDTSKYAKTESGISELFNSVVTFAAAVYYSAAATFNSTLTVVGDFIPAWTKNNSSRAADQYEKIKIVAGKLPATVTTNYSVAHGISDWHTIKSWTTVVHDDSSNVISTSNVFSDFSSGTGRLYSVCFLDSLNCNIRIPLAAVNMVNDSVFFRIVYTDWQR